MSIDLDKTRDEGYKGERSSAKALRRDEPGLLRKQREGQSGCSGGLHAESVRGQAKEWVLKATEKSLHCILHFILSR